MVSLIVMILFITGTIVSGAVLGKAQPSGEQVSVEIPPEETSPEEFPQAENLFKTVMEQLEQQKAVDKALQAELERGNYTFDEPLVVLDPYDESPLAALIMFQTETATRVEITIPGDDEDTGAIHTFEELVTRHVVPVYGLYPDQVNTITLKLLAEDGQTLAENRVEIETEPLPDWLDCIILTKSYQGDYARGLNYIQGACFEKFAFDKDGAVRWFRNDQDLIYGADYAYAGHRFMMAKVSAGEGEGDAAIIETDRLGKIYNLYYSPYGVHHDISSIPNGNLLVTGSHGQTVEDFIYEVDIKTGEITHTLDLKTALQRTRFDSIQDWCHNNSVVYDESDGSIIISSNIQCTVAKLTWPEGQIKWLLSDPVEYMPRLQSYLLTPVGEDFEYSYNQHHATILPDYDHNADTIDILLFDNGRTRFDRDKELQRAISAQEIVTPENYSRLVHYRINEKQMTVKQIWQYGKERGEELYAFGRGSAQLLENDNIMGFFDKQNDPQNDVAVSGNVVEVDAQGDLVWDAEILRKGKRGNYIGYRAFRFPIYFPDDTEFDIYTEGRNAIPQAIQEEHR